MSVFPTPQRPIPGDLAEKRMRALAVMCRAWELTEIHSMHVSGLAEFPPAPRITLMVDGDLVEFALTLVPVGPA